MLPYKWLSARLRRLGRQDARHYLSIEQVAVDSMSEIVHKPSQNNTFLLALCKRCLLTFSLALFLENVHLPVTEISDTTAVLEPVVRRTREHIVVWAKLMDILESLHLRRVDDKPTVARQSDLPINYITQLDHLV